ncbi:DUF2516 family protein [Streptomyces gobiensis]|uniref:DUF2516 family protein n=1 Tax=Streptomyces gobiensis TaxID=2875706 RepID=UPI001E3AA17C|nr:DUF2516 family protein [Streptomyces gobiensis]UGY92869.1 DUF2516 family protein [Streptomyces gobiensis]
MLLQGFGTLMSFVFLGLLVFAIFCVVDAALRREDAYRAADKKTKQFWLIILGLTVAAGLFVPSFFLLKIAGLIANIVYMVDVRPALIQVSGGGGGSYRGSSSDGPYGPYNR